MPWKFLHHVIAHSLRWLTSDARWVLRFHDFTAGRAWPLNASDEPEDR